MRADLAALLARAQARAPLRPPLVVYGAGDKGRRTLRFLAARGLEVSGVLDSNARPGQLCEGTSVQRPADWLRAHAARDFEVVLAIHNPGVDLAALGAQIAALGFRRLVQPVELHQMFGEDLPADYFLGPAARYGEWANDIERARGLFADEASRTWFERALEFRLGGDYAVLPRPSASDQYRPADLPRWREPMRLADCGAFDGDSVRQLRAGGYRIDACAAFEADMANFRRLAGEPALPQERYLFPCAVGARSAVLAFASGRGGASRVDPSGEAAVACVRLDDAIAGFRPTLIKMDVEGAEHDALLGAAGVVAVCRPGLAISAYHRPDDLWRLAQLVDSWRLGYRLHLRGHAHSTFDLVLYAVAA